jgi:dUTP pyrophosphatase
MLENQKENHYIIGFILNDIEFIKKNNKIIISLPIENESFLIYIKNLINNSLIITPNFNYSIVSFTIIDTVYISKLLSYVDKLIDDNFSIQDYSLDFIRGYFDNKGNIYTHDNLSQCIISGEFVSYIRKIISIPSISYDNIIVFSGTNCIDFLGKIYNNIDDLMLPSNYKKYINILGYNNNNDLPSCSIFKSNINAIIPSKNRESDVGYDLTILEEYKKINSKTSLYNTGIQIKVQLGYYCEVIPRSSLSKSGYMLSNSIGIIDPGYTDNIYIALTKIDEFSPNLIFPFKCCQLIFRKQEFFKINEVNTSFEKTDRNKGGFGSTS